MAKVSEVQGKYKCDHCKKIFEGKKVKLITPHKNFSAPLWQITAVEKDGTIVGTSFAGLKPGDKLLACPLCSKMHPNGFDRAK